MFLGLIQIFHELSVFIIIEFVKIFNRILLYCFSFIFFKWTYKNIALTLSCGKTTLNDKLLAWFILLFIITILLISIIWIFWLPQHFLLQQFFNFNFWILKWNFAHWSININICVVNNGRAYFWYVFSLKWALRFILEAVKLTCKIF